MGAVNNAPCIVVNNKKVLGIYNQSHPNEENMQKVIPKVQDWFKVKAVEIGWDELKISGGQCILENHLKKIVIDKICIIRGKSMDNILNKDIEAVKILVKEITSLIKTHEHKYDRTFSSVVKTINKDSTYTVMDNGGVERKLKCSIPNVVLKIGQYVWVKVPCGRLEDMHICGVK